MWYSYYPVLIAMSEAFSIPFTLIKISTTQTTGWLELCLLVPELNVFLWRPQIWWQRSPFTVHVKLSSIIFGAHYHYQYHLHLSLPVTFCPFKFLSQSHIPSVTLTQHRAPVTVVNSLRNSFYHTVSFLHTSATLLSHRLFVIGIIIFLCRSHHSNPS